ncbi:MAG TPA: class I SAM-dependent methyltransferase [Fimbriimonadaceae bacterium]|nr:class I SAM-dependent methyltransferase [Fimbriimonadaceae bacterium]HRJ33506.1 class I SAM-dependent methyltransferase [Fimbriimonadaceae bacterium]
MGSVEKWIKMPVIGPVLLLGYRYRTASGYIKQQRQRFRDWLWKSNETTNYTFNLEGWNERYLAAFLSEATNRPYEEIEGYLDEIRNDVALRSHIESKTAASDYVMMADPEVRLGKRIGWYALVRALKPQLVVETGVDKGLGTVVLAAALLKNRQDGFPGKVYGTDINPKAGYLLDGPYAEVGQVLYGDSIESLRGLTEPVDLFINDSDHSADYERREYEVIAEKLSPGAYILGDNAHATEELFRFCRATGRAFVFFREQPKNHWYPGGAISLGFFNKTS